MIDQRCAGGDGHQLYLQGAGYQGCALHSSGKLRTNGSETKYLTMLTRDEVESNVLKDQL